LGGFWGFHGVALQFKVAVRFVVGLVFVCFICFLCPGFGEHSCRFLPFGSFIFLSTGSFVMFFCFGPFGSLFLSGIRQVFFFLFTHDLLESIGLQRRGQVLGFGGLLGGGCWGGGVGGFRPLCAKGGTRLCLGTMDGGGGVNVRYLPNRKFMCRSPKGNICHFCPRGVRGLKLGSWGSEVWGLPLGVFGRRKTSRMGMD